jgi:hypothetical protein
MFLSRKVDGECKLVAYCNHAAGDVRSWDRTRIPLVNQKKDGFKGYLDGVSLVGHYLQSFVQVVIQSLNQHRVVISSGEDMAVDLQEIKQFLTHAKELAVLIEDDGVAKSVSQDNFHYSLRKGGC